MSRPQEFPAGAELIPISESPSLPSLADEPIPRVVDPAFSYLTLGGVRPKDPSARLTATFLQESFSLYRGRCECGAAYDNNCAHFLTDAMIRAGLPQQFPGAYAKCAQGRLIRAKECLAWFKSFSTGFAQNHSGISSGYWFVYQESGGQGHVCIHHESSSQYEWRGTTDLPSWPVQWHYFY